MNHKAGNLQHRERSQHLCGRQSRRHGDLVRGAAAAGRQCVVDPLLGPTESIKD